MSLDTWRDISNPATRKIAIVGDSTTEIGWAATIRDRATARWGYGGYGVRHMGKEWTPAGSWTKGTATDAWCIGFHNNGVSPTNGTWLGNGSANTFTWTRPSDCPAISGFKLLVCDGSGAGNFAYSIDGGAWTNVSTTWAGANALKQITINTAVTSTVAVRAANAAGTAVNLYIVGIEPLCSTTGVKVHDISASGAFSNLFIRDATSGYIGDWTQWWLQEQPQLVFMNFVNDLTVWGAPHPADFQTRYETFGDLVTGYGGVIVYYSYFYFSDGSGGNSPTYADQADAHSRILTAAKARGGLYYDLEAIYGDFAAVTAAGIIGSDKTHPTVPKGSNLMANHAWNIVADERVPRNGLVR